MDDDFILLECVYDLNGLDGLHVYLPQRRPKLLVVGARALIHLLNLSPRRSFFLYIPVHISLLSATTLV